MANRNQGDYYNTLRRQQPQNWRDEEERDYRNQADEGNEADAGVRGGNYDQGRVQYGRYRDEQRSSQERYAGYGDFGRGEYGGGRSGLSGQDRYGQSGSGQSMDERGRYRQDVMYGQRNYNTDTGGWNEPYGEGQQYDERGDYGSRYNEDWGRSRYGAPRSGPAGYGRRAGYGYGAPQGEGSQGMGQHSGKSPKGYQRSDERIRELVCERLREDPHIDPSDVTVTVKDGRITLDGTVDSRQAKHAIEDVADQFGTQEVQNNLRVQKAGQEPGESARQGKAASLKQH